MGALIRWFLRSRVAANLLMIALIAFGIAAAQQVTVRTFPEIAVEAVTVEIEYPGATPTEVADAILKPIEAQLQGLEGVRKLTSVASQSLGVVTAELTRSADLTSVKDDIETEIDRITTFPDAADDPRVTEVDPDELAIQLALTGDTDLSVLKDLARRARDDITARPGISEAEVIGVPRDRIDIEVSRDTLRAYGIALTEFADRIAALDLDLSGGTIETGESEIQLRTVGESQTAEGFRDIIVFTSQTGGRVRLDDIADVSETFEETATSASISGRPAVFLSVYRNGDEQVLSIVDELQAYLDQELRPVLPEGIEVLVWRNQGEELQSRINLLAKNGAIGVALILLVLMLFLDLRIAAWVAVGVVVSFVGAFGLMLLFGTTINQLSLFGFILALGIVVDDAIVVGENIYSELESGDDAQTAAERGVLRVWRPILFSVATTVTAFVPLLFLPGSSGSFISPVAAVVIFVLLLSLAESFFVLPTHLSHIRIREPRCYSPRRVTEAVRRRVDGLFDRFINGPLRRLVSLAIVHPIFVVAMCVAILLGASGLVAGGFVKFIFFPDIEGNFVTVELEFPEGTSDEATRQTAQQLVAAAQRAAGRLGDEGLLSATAVTLGFSTNVSPDGASAVYPGNIARVEAKLLDADRRQIAARAFEAAWREEAGEIAGAQNVLYSASVVGVGDPIVLQVSASSEANRNAAVAALREALVARPGVFDLRDDRFSAADEIAIGLKPAARVYGVTLDQLAREVRGAFFGALVTQIPRDREEVDVRVRLPQSERNSIADLEALRIAIGDQTIPIGVLADLTFRPAPTTVRRLNGQTIATLYGDVDNAVTTGGAETGYVMSEVVPQIVTDYPDVSVTAGGEQEESGRFTSTLAFNFLMAMFAIYAILTLAFASYVRPAIVLLVLPFGAVGAIFGHALLGIDLTLLSMFGIIGLSGVIVNGALLIVDFIIEGEAQGKSSDDAIRDATLSRFRPIILTTLTTFLGVTPLVLETSVQAQFLIPTAVALGCGVLFGSVLQMALVPALASLHRRLRGGKSQSQLSPQAAR